MMTENHTIQTVNQLLEAKEVLQRDPASFLQTITKLSAWIVHPKAAFRQKIYGSALGKLLLQLVVSANSSSKLLPCYKLLLSTYMHEMEPELNKLVESLIILVNLRFNPLSDAQIQITITKSQFEECECHLSCLDRSSLPLLRALHNKVQYSNAQPKLLPMPTEKINLPSPTFNTNTPLIVAPIVPPDPSVDYHSIRKPISNANLWWSDGIVLPPFSQSSTRSFQLNLPVFSEGELIQIKAFREGDDSQTPHWPNALVEMKLNNTPLRFYSYGKHYPCLASRTAGDTSSLSLIFDSSISNLEKHLFCVDTVHMIDMPTFKKKMGQSCCTNEQLKKLVGRKSVELSLICPISKLRMRRPARSSICIHFACFDLLPYLTSIAKQLTITCPICFVYLTLDSLLNDEFVASILDKTASDRVIVNPNLLWNELELVEDSEDDDSMLSPDISD